MTGAAVAHYIGGVRTLRAGPNPSPRDREAGILHTAEFTYDARVVSHGPEGSVVELRISWQDYCGGLCSFGFSHSRRVGFGPNGEVISVEGDEPPLYEVS